VHAGIFLILWAVLVPDAAMSAAPPSVNRPAAAQPRSYLKPSTPKVGGIHHLVLIYAGNRGRPAWDAEKLLPYVARIDRQGKPADWLFDGFLWIEFATDDGSYLHVPVKDRRPVDRNDWQWLLDRFFDPSHGIPQLQAAVVRAGETLGPRKEPVRLVITMPTPYVATTRFGPLVAGGASLDFRRDADRLAALEWYIEAAVKRWHSIDAPGVRLAGFYWLDESIGPDEERLVRETADFLHRQGMKLYWIPYFGARGIATWKAMGIDAMMLQPNYFFQPELPPQRLALAARNAMRVGGGVELEVDGRAAHNPEFRPRFPAYLDAGVKYGFMRGTLLGYYEGGGALLESARSADPAVREIYDMTCRFVKGTYRPQGTTPLPANDQTGHNHPGNLALVSRGARVIGQFVPGRGLEPEQLIDGNYDEFGGAEGFAAFSWPGSFVLQLPRVETIHAVDTRLWDLDERTFRYCIDISIDGKRWTQVADKSRVECRGWQHDAFSPQRAQQIRFTGLHNTANSLFQIVEVEVY
jgi:hypothetical protein